MATVTFQSVWFNAFGLVQAHCIVKGHFLAGVNIAHGDKEYLPLYAGIRLAGMVKEEGFFHRPSIGMMICIDDKILINLNAPVSYLLGDWDNTSTKYCQLFSSLYPLC